MQAEVGGYEVISTDGTMCTVTEVQKSWHVEGVEKNPSQCAETW